jgi:glutaredoxin 3
MTITIYMTDWCGYCVRAKALLDAKGLPYEEINLEGEPHFRQKLMELTGGWTVPQIVIDGRPISMRSSAPAGSTRPPSRSR